MIINSLLDTDLYKFTMMQVVLHHFPGAVVEYHFKCRTEGIDLRPYADEIKSEIQHLGTLKLQDDELEYLDSLAYMKHDFVEFLKLFRLNPACVEVKTEPEFAIIIRGAWLHTILFEVPLLAIINEIYFRHTEPNAQFEEGERRLQNKIKLVKSEAPAQGFKFSDFGTRRRFSFAWQQQVLETLVKELGDYLSGTSNVYFAMQLGIKAIGTMAHEYIQACQSLGPRLAYSQKFAFEKWAQEYRGDLGIALSDTYGTKAFLNDFDLYFCKLFDGARHDSGDPFEWTEQLLAHYEKMRVEAKNKTLVYSNSLTFDLALALYQRYHKKTNPVFGIGTHLTNDLGYRPLDIVIKMIRCDGQPVAKVSECPGKSICVDESYLQYLKQVFKL